MFGLSNILCTVRHILIGPACSQPHIDLISLLMLPVAVKGNKGESHWPWDGTQGAAILYNELSSLAEVMVPNRQHAIISTNQGSSSMMHLARYFYIHCPLRQTPSWATCLQLPYWLIGCTQCLGQWPWRAQKSKSIDLWMGGTLGQDARWVIGWSNDLVPNRQAITSTNDDPVHWWLYQGIHMSTVHWDIFLWPTCSQHLHIDSVHSLAWPEGLKGTKGERHQMVMIHSKMSWHKTI